MFDRSSSGDLPRRLTIRGSGRRAAKRSGGPAPEGRALEAVVMRHFH